MQAQYKKIFFGEHDPFNATCPTSEERKAIINQNNPNSPFSKFIGNEKAIKKLQATAFDALGKPDHLCRDLAFAIFGPTSSGKSSLARIFAETVELPFVEVSPKSIRKLDDLFKEIERSLNEEGIELVEYKCNHYCLPPIVVFIDEIHAVCDPVIQGLLKATEYNDSKMVTESKKIVNTRNVCWMIATTDEGMLFDAFRTRFTPIRLKYLNKASIARIIKLNHPYFDDRVCRLIAHYNSRIPRKALEFARYMKLIQKMETNKNWEQIARETARDEGIDQYGMHEIHLKIITALGQQPIAKNRMPTIVGSKTEEVERYIMPWLLTETDDSPALVTVSSRGYRLTDAGLAELNRRNIPNKGEVVLGKKV